MRRGPEVLAAATYFTGLTKARSTDAGRHAAAMLDYMAALEGRVSDLERSADELLEWVNTPRVEDSEATEPELAPVEPPAPARGARFPRA